MYQVIFYEREKMGRICSEYHEQMPTDSEVFELGEDIGSRYAEVYFDKYETKTFDLLKSVYLI
jgi:hypothetical protein